MEKTLKTKAKVGDRDEGLHATNGKITTKNGAYLVSLRRRLEEKKIGDQLETPMNVFDTLPSDFCFHGDCWWYVLPF